MAFFHRSPYYYGPATSSHLTPYSFAGAPKVYIFQPKSEELSEDIASTRSRGANVEQQLTQHHEHEETPDIYSDKNVHIQDQGDAFTFSLDLPGIKSSDAKVELRDGVLRVEAERKFGDKGSAKQVKLFLLKEQYVDGEKLQANLADGVLTITVPKKAAAKPVAIPVAVEYPPEATEDAKELRMSVDLPGVKVSDLKLELHDGTITLHAERKFGERFSTIDKHFSIDEARVDSNTFKAFLLDGVLTITGSRKDAPEPKAIPVSSGTAIEANKEDAVVVETVMDEK